MSTTNSGDSGTTAKSVAKSAATTAATSAKDMLGRLDLSKKRGMFLSDSRALYFSDCAVSGRAASQASPTFSTCLRHVSPAAETAACRPRQLPRQLKTCLGRWGPSEKRGRRWKWRRHFLHGRTTNSITASEATLCRHQVSLVAGPGPGPGDARKG